MKAKIWLEQSEKKGEKQSQRKQSIESKRKERDEINTKTILNVVKKEGIEEKKRNTENVFHGQQITDFDWWWFTKQNDRR